MCLESHENTAICLQDESTKDSIRSIFFPGPQEQKSVLLKRGPVLFGGEDEMELMLFTNGFVLSHVQLDTLVDSLFGVRKDKKDQLDASERQSSEILSELFDEIDTNQNRCK